MFKFKEINNKKILVSDLLKSTRAKHLFTTRESVVTPKDMPDLSEAAQINFAEIAEYLQVEPENIIFPVQTHSCNIQIAKAGSTYPNTDALIIDPVNSGDIAILLNFADCTPIILYDEKNNVGAISHAGWRGTAARIVPKTLNVMHKNFNTDFKDIVALIGPAISMKNYQVGTEVFEQLENSMSKKYCDYFDFDRENEKYNVDLKTINQHQLEELGVTRIDKCEYCTYDSVDVFFSYRKENGKTARHSAILKLIKD